MAIPLSPPPVAGIVMLVSWSRTLYIESPGIGAAQLPDKATLSLCYFDTSRRSLALTLQNLQNFRLLTAKLLPPGSRRQCDSASSIL